jgi:cell division protein FtsQ
MSRLDSLYAPPARFQRGERACRTKKLRRKIPGRTKYLLLFVILTALVFLAARQIYLFAVTWKTLEIRDIQVFCADERVRGRALETAKSVSGRNIFLLDIEEVRGRLALDPWIKDIRIRKVFPSTLTVDIIPRTPFALLQKDELWLVDANGFELEEANRSDYPGLPLLTDESRFEQGAAEKKKRAMECLADLPEEDRNRVNSLDLSEPENVILQFRDDETRLKLGTVEFGSKVAIYEKNRDRWMDEFGPLAYVDLRLPDRVCIGLGTGNADSEKTPSPTGPDRLKAVKEDRDAQE